MSTSNDIIRSGVEAALKLAELARWGELTLSSIAEAAGLGLEDFHGVADKADLSAAVDGVLDEAMSEGSLDPEETPRTRLFDVLMLRFEAMEARRDGVMSFLRWRDRTLPGLAIRARSRIETARWALACAGLDGDSRLPRGLELVGLAWAYGRAEAAWKEETSADLTQTMAALDRELIKAEDRVSFLTSRKRRRAKQDMPETEVTED